MQKRGEEKVRPHHTTSRKNILEDFLPFLCGHLWESGHHGSRSAVHPTFLSRLWCGWDPECQVLLGTQG